jgi:hypothetical protein
MKNLKGSEWAAIAVLMATLSCAINRDFTGVVIGVAALFLGVIMLERR